MRSGHEVTMKVAILAAFLISAHTACSGSNPPLDATSKFAGTWTYQPGSTIVAACAGAASQTIDLSKVPPQNRPGYFIFSPSGGASLHEVDARGCEYDWTVSGDAATAASGQSCANFPDGRGGSRLVHLVSGTKSTADGASMAIDVHFATDAPSSCAIRVEGTATKSSPDV
jgi:hypothetical protein